MCTPEVLARAKPAWHGAVCVHGCTVISCERASHLEHQASGTSRCPVQLRKHVKLPDFNAVRREHACQRYWAAQRRRQAGSRLLFQRRAPGWITGPYKSVAKWQSNERMVAAHMLQPKGGGASVGPVLLQATSTGPHPGTPHVRMHSMYACNISVRVRHTRTSKVGIAIYGGGSTAPMRHASQAAQPKLLRIARGGECHHLLAPLDHRPDHPPPSRAARPRLRPPARPRAKPFKGRCSAQCPP